MKKEYCNCRCCRTCLYQHSPLPDAKGGLCPNAQHHWLLLFQNIIVRPLQLLSIDPLLTGVAYILSLVLADYAALRI